jgi:hypothetical protein
MASGNTISVKRQALRYVASSNPARRHPLIDKVRHAREKRGGWRTASSRS